VNSSHRTELKNVSQQPTTASIGLGRLLSAARAATNGETVGALLAAFAARGNLLFDMSHKTAVLPLTQTLAFLQAKPIQININTKGQVFSVIYDYVYRNRSFEDMNFWTFVASHKIVKRSDDQDTLTDDGVYTFVSKIIILLIHIIFHCTTTKRNILTIDLLTFRVGYVTFD